MPYTILSRGRPIGTTDLGFIRLGGPSRSGWFHPNAEGERLMSVIASVLPAMHAYLHRDVLGSDGKSIVQPHLIRSTLFADLAEALQHAESFDLTLHREDGSLVPTELVGIQDTEQLLAMSDWDDVERDARAALVDDAPGDALWDAHELDQDVDTMLEDETTDDVDEWMPDCESTAFPRYQVHVVLVDDDLIP